MPATILLASLDRVRTLAVPLLLALALNGCSSLDYYGQLASGQLQLLHAREPVARVLADPSRDATLRQRLALSQRARVFASAELALPDNGSYRVYADIHRPFVVWNVFATPELSLAPVTHCFPIAGCVAYRGYYQPGRARGAAALMREEGLDTWIGGVEAYSTLGWFDDPILSSMVRWDEDRLAAVIFHELAHQKLYVADDSAFNESFASFVEREGLRQWRASQGLPAGGEEECASASSSLLWCWPAASAWRGSTPAIARMPRSARPSRPSSSAYAVITASCATASGRVSAATTAGSKAR